MPSLDIEGIATAAVMSYLGWVGARALPNVAPTSVVAARRRTIQSAQARNNGGVAGFPLPKPMSLRELLGQTYQKTIKIRTTIITSTSAVTETNFQFNLTQMPEATSFANIFDSWTILRADVKFISQQGPGSTSSVPIIHAALDYDGVATLSGSLTAIDEIDSVVVRPIGSGRSYSRRLYPMCSPDVSSVASASIGRFWIDTIQPGVSWNGLRTMFETAVTGITTITVEITITYGFRTGR